MIPRFEHYPLDCCAPYVRSALRQLIASIIRRLIPPSETLEGYEQPELVEVIFQKTKAYNPQGEWPAMIGISSVLDFGGGCGLHYKLARRQSPDIRWAVVETPAMVERASELTTDRLRFFSSIPDAADWLGPVDVMHSTARFSMYQIHKRRLGFFVD